MSQFYARYIPPAKQSSSTTDQPNVAEKRKNHTIHPEVTTRPSKKRKAILEQDATEDGPAATVSITEQQSNGLESAESVQEILSKYSVSKQAKLQDPNIEIDTRRKARSRESEKQNTEYNNSDVAFTEKHTSREGTQGNGAELDDQQDDEEMKKHSGVLRKYDKSRRRSRLSEGAMQVDEDAREGESVLPEPELRDLVPLPQPINLSQEPKEPLYSTLPSWQSEALHVDTSNLIRLETLDFSNKVISNLRSQGVEELFPIQSTVIPLLMSSKSSDNGDLCVSAATGSGKTLAYVLPIIETLRKSTKSGLRALIVVPTRELVKQVRETCETCAAGSGLNTVTALGSRSLHSEQAALIQEEEVFDPVAYKREQNCPVDWANFSLQASLREAALTACTERENYVKRRRIKADILITTPGRLVEHLQSTPGFHLDDVQWLVIDEADRLLNESYQDWIDIVVPALQSRRATAEEDRILTYMRMDLPPRKVRKILLSATMTRDISKLNSIGLNRPKLVILNSPSENSAAPTDSEKEKNDGKSTGDPSGKFVLPATLSETAVTFRDGSDKPLLLLQLLDMASVATAVPKLGVSKEESNGAYNNRSQSSETTSDSESDSDSSSDSSSDNDSTTDTESSTSSSADRSINSQQQPASARLDNPKSKKQSSVRMTRILIFVRSTAAASRLSRLLSIISPSLSSSISTLTRSTASSASSRKALSAFRTRRTPILIATDRASRGIDVPGLEHVISYDIPGTALTYVHRVGRTARAGESGHAWSMVEHREGRWFWSEIGGKTKDCVIQRNTKVKKLNVEVVDDKSLRDRYDAALQTLGEEVRGT